MGSTLKMDHVVIHVDDLDAAVRDYISLGFRVIPGGEHQRFGSHNALIVLPDDTYLELIAFKHPPPSGTDEMLSPAVERFRNWSESGEGLVDFALVPESVEEQIEQARSFGLEVEGPFPGSRMRPDGLKVAWLFGFPQATGLPFLCADVTPRLRRVPEGEVRVHPNGATGIAELIVAVADFDMSLSAYRALLGTDPRILAVSPLPHTRVARFELDATTLTVAAPAGRASPLHACLSARDNNLFELRLHGTADDNQLDSAKAHGARITWDV